ncbi:MAG: 5'/3'-nucleotidase SurE [Chlamydia sp. 32-24]|nr:MAG: 5'/3'-nucleotidase SurE [Chlamydia sp. 32-24]
MKNKPNILIINDDGINAPGIHYLWQSLKNIANTTIIAPAAEQSATSVSITLRTPLQVKEMKWENSLAWSVSGTPVDCVKLALSVLLSNPPDLIVSGINRGTNAGRNILYSGTIGATIEAALRGFPAIAFSCFDSVGTDYEGASLYIPSITQYVLDNPLPKGTLLNVNFPSNSHVIQGVKFTKHGKEYWVENPDKRFHPAEGSEYYWLGARLAEFQEEEDCDITWLKKGFLTAVPINVEELTHLNLLNERREMFENLFSNQKAFAKVQ